MEKLYARLSETQGVEQVPGIMRYTLSYNEDVMMCRFSLRQGAEIPLHTHAAVQNGFVLSGKVLFWDDGGNERVVEPGDSYTFPSNSPHAARCLEAAELLENFLPLRREYI